MGIDVLRTVRVVFHGDQRHVFGRHAIFMRIFIRQQSEVGEGKDTVLCQIRSPVLAR